MLALNLKGSGLFLTFLGGKAIHFPIWSYKELAQSGAGRAELQNIFQSALLPSGGQYDNYSFIDSKK